jgi:DNA-binding NtrC family response regulator
MAAKRIHAKKLNRLLNTAVQPVYVLDEELTIVFLNQACSNLLGPIAEKLPGTKCRYHSLGATSSADQAAAGLCPPPGASASQVIAATVSFYDENGRMRQRRAWFYHIGSPPRDFIGVVAIVDTQDLPEDIVSIESLSADEAQGVSLHDAVRRFRQEAAGRFRLDQLVGNSPAMRLARRQVELAASSRSSVLLVGPPGSGRQHLAATIHYASPLDLSAMSPASGLIPLDCSVLGADLIQSTISALARAKASGEKAEQTSLLLNGVDELPAELQLELAALFTKKTFPLRLISTARTALRELAGRGLFREDLAAALSTITIFLPPLANRREDLPLLAQALLERCNARHDKQAGGFAPEALDRLFAYSWPGNIDELAEVVNEAYQRAGGAEIGVEDLPDRLRLAAQAAAYPRRTEETIVLDEYLGRVERELIRRALARAKGNKAKAARLLGLTRPRLYRRMVQLGLEEKSKEE